ncbi:MAG: hypothetical protein ACC641_07040 [Acidiferrobacterales bacterium]
MDVVTHTLRRHHVPYFFDPVGNIVIGVTSVKEYRALLRGRENEPIRVLAAHMDHPGFHGVKWLPNNHLQVKWFGGSPVKHLNGTCVWLADTNGALGRGTLHSPKLHKSKRYLHSAEIWFEIRTLIKGPIASDIFGGFAFRKPVWQSGKRLYANAADDLVGVFAIVETTIAAFRIKTKTAPPFIGLLTRAEEVGFVGAIAHFELEWLTRAKRPCVFVSLEASRTLPGAELGKGPVVRLGDRRTVYESSYLKTLIDLAQRVLPGRHQQRIMDGGACEAAAATIWNIPAIGITLPLANYHNQGFEGGQDCLHPQGPAPEYVHMDDIEGLLKLCRALVKPGLNWREPWKKQQQDLIKNARKYQRYL